MVLYYCSRTIYLLASLGVHDEPFIGRQPRMTFASQWSAAACSDLDDLVGIWLVLVSIDTSQTRPAAAYIVPGVYLVHSALDIATASPVT